jgi:hypothetical protein
VDVQLIIEPYGLFSFCLCWSRHLGDSLRRRKIAFVLIISFWHFRESRGPAQEVSIDGARRFVCEHTFIIWEPVNSDGGDSGSYGIECLLQS